MVGYCESLTDPSYRGQILVLTYPLIGNYGVPSRDEIDHNLNGLSKHFESNDIHVAALVVGTYSADYSHFLAKSSLGQWLKEKGVPAIYGIDTRALTKKIRSGGSTLAKLLMLKRDTPHPNQHSGISFSIDAFENVEWCDPNARNLVAEVSTKQVILYKTAVTHPIKDKNGRTLQILAVDVGMKNNQIRCLTARGVDVKVVPHDYDFVADQEYDGLFISNGPGDPALCQDIVERLRQILSMKSKPVFGICLGHQLLALAAGAKTRKMKFGNRGHNIPCTDLETGRCYITSQNHGFEVDVTTLPSQWKPFFINANDGSNEGIKHQELPFFSVQFHPEAAPGPHDTAYLFNDFIQYVQLCANKELLVPIKSTKQKIIVRYESVKKVLILGSGGLSIGQAGEFDYSGSQAIKALKEQGIYTVLINPNIATIQTSKGLADKVYFLPVKSEFVRKVIHYEKPDGILVTFGGQTALNVGIKMKDEFSELGVKVLGTPIETIIVTEDRELFAQSMRQINEKCAISSSASSIQDAIAAGKNIGYPVIIRAAYALGGLGSGFASNETELVEICSRAFAVSPQVLIEKSMKGWKEIEYEVVRDAYDNCVTVCNMENFDPAGIHTGDSIVVAPSQTLSDEDYNMLRDTAVNVIRHLGVIGECNIQYMLNPDSKEYCIIEVNARLSRSSALASKATGYPLAFVAAKLALGVPLNELKNVVTKVTCACFEPSLDYVVVKIPRWDLKKFSRVSTKVGSAMKSVGEVMAVGRTFEETIQKAIRAVDNPFIGFTPNDYVAANDEELANPSDQRLFAIANALYSGKYTVDRIWELTKIDKWFLNKLKDIVDLDRTISRFNPQSIPPSLILKAKQYGFSDRQLGKVLKTSELSIRKIRHEHGIIPYVKRIDTVAAEFPSSTNYLYMTYNASEHDIDFNEHGIMVLGSGVYRIGSSVEFDWCSVRAMRTLREHNYKTIMVNYNPETVSTDYDEAHRLYFENITLERILDIYEVEKSAGVIVSMGGQTPNNIALALHRQNIKIFGTSPEQIDNAENRYKFSRMCDSIGVDQPLWKELTSFEDAETFCDKVGFPVLVRPSYVLSGAAMNVVYSREDLRNYLKQAVAVSAEYPVVISKFIENAKEIEMDAAAKNGKVIYSVISEHVENAGIHSGDATLILPPQDLEADTIRKIKEATKKIADALNITGPFNIQFIAKDNEIKVIECNVRASRSFPFCSKVMNVDLIELSIKAMMEIPFQEPRTRDYLNYVAVKVPQFSFSRLSGADPVLGVEMASTGEVACFGKDKYEAYIKGMIATGFTVPKKNILLSIGSFKEKQEFLPSVWKLHRLGYNLFATTGTADFILEHGIPVKCLEALDGADSSNDQKAQYNLTQHLANNLIDLYINLPSQNRYRRPANYITKGYQTRRLAVDLSIPLMTNIKCAKLFVEALSRGSDFEISHVDCQSLHEVMIFPGLVDAALVVKNKKYIQKDTWESSTGGFTTSVVQLLDEPHDCVVSDVSCDVFLVTYFEFCDEISVAKISEALRKRQDDRVVVVRSSGSQLASILLVASLLKRQVHVTGIFKEDDIELIAMSKKNGLNVSCDVSVFNLFLSNQEKLDPSWFGNASDVLALWKNFDVIDCLTSNMQAKALNLENVTASKLMLTLLLNSCYERKISVANIKEKMWQNPCKIFNLNPPSNSSVEVEISRLSTYSCSLFPEKMFGNISRVQYQGELILIDGKSSSKRLIGNLLSKDAMEQSIKTVEHSLSQIEEPAVQDQRIKKALEKVELIEKTITRDGELNFDNRAAFFGQNILTSNQFTRQDLHTLFTVAQQMRTIVERHGATNLLSGKVLANLFYEPSTRTSASFEAAMIRLGGQVINVAPQTSSIQKGESLADTVRTLGSYCDALVIRHPEQNSVQVASNFSKIPVLNAGDGTGEHPTQAFLDIFTIREELGTVNGLTITFVGDLKNGRTVHSLVRLLSCYDGVKINYVSPDSLRMPGHIISEVSQKGIFQVEHNELTEDLLARSDVLYVTRIQKERFKNTVEYERVKDCFCITTATMEMLKPTAIVMHPMPRVNEIDSEVDFDSRAAYFRQMKYGLFARMALLALVLAPSKSLKASV